MNSITAVKWRHETVGSIAFAPWALLGLLATLFSLWIFSHWMLSPTAFVPVQRPSLDSMEASGVERIRALEFISSTIAVLALLWFLLRPWWRDGRAPIVGLTMIGALVSYVLDTTVNYMGYYMAWNVHSINFGTWAAQFPGHGGPTRYAEALLWGPPMYIYFGVVLGSIQLKVVDWLRGPLGLPAAAALSFGVAFMLDVMAESLIIRSTEAYAWSNTVGSLTLWAGEQHQFPLYEALLVAIYSSGNALLLASVRRNHESFIERGISRFAPGMQGLMRFFSAVGFATLLTAIYFSGFNLFSLFADTPISLPGHLQHQG